MSKVSNGGVSSLRGLSRHEENIPTNRGTSDSWKGGPRLLQLDRRTSMLARIVDVEDSERGKSGLGSLAHLSNTGSASRPRYRDATS